MLNDRSRKTEAIKSVKSGENPFNSVFGSLSSVIWNHRKGDIIGVYYKRIV